MSPLFKLEIRRAFGGRLFKLCLIIGTGLAIAAAIEGITRFYTDFEQVMSSLDTMYMSQFANGAYTLWMPMAVMRSIPNLFFFLTPLFIGLSWSWSWRSDTGKGYAANLLCRSTMRAWLTAKTGATFLCGGTVVALPLLVNLVIVFCFVPAYTPNIIDVVYNGLWTKVFLSELLYTYPIAYVAVRFVLDFVLAGLWATTVLAVSYVVRDRVAIVAMPFLVLVVIKYISESLYALTGVQWGSLTILDQLKARGDAYYYNEWVVLVDIALMLVVSLAVPLITRRRDVL